MSAKRVRTSCFALLLGGALAGTANAASEADVERVRSFALLLGRGLGCELDTDRAVAQIGVWFDRAFPRVSADRQRNLSLFEQSVRRHAQQQQSGQSPDDCADVRSAFQAMGW